MTEQVAQLNAGAVELLNLLGTRMKDAGTTPGAMLHGPGGLLATPGLNRQVVNAAIMPRGLSGRLPVRASQETNEIFAIFTGLLASSGNEPTAQCADWPTVGQFKVCRQQHPFGQQGRMSQVLNVKYAGQVVNRGEFTDNTLLGMPDTGDNTLPAAVNWQRVFQTEYEKKLGELYAGYFRDYARYVYTGNPQTTAGSQGFMQYRGLDLLINTGKRDAITGAACPAADSVVIDFNGTNVSTSGSTIYNVVANVVTNMKRLAEQLGMEVKWALTMRYGAFWAITNIWPCVYATAGCNNTALLKSASLEEATDFRDRMRKGRYLLVEGEEIEVIIDDAIVEDPAAGGTVGTYESDIYLIPLTVNGQPATYWEYFGFNEQAIAAAAQMAPTGYFSTLQNGRFLFVRLSPTHTCVQVEVIERPRLILLTPFLAARFTNARYNITVHERDVFPTETYFVNGGGVNSPLPYFYPNSGGG